MGEFVPETDPTDATPRHRRPIAVISLVVALVVVAFDQLTKYWAVHVLTGHDEQHVVWTLQWNLSYNSGMAFSRGRGLGPVIGLVAIVVVIALIVGSAKLEGRLARVAAGMLLGGAVGNLCDRVFRGDGWLNGRVVDFVDLQWWPIFNVADVGVTVGGALFVFASTRSSRTASRRRAVSADQPGAAS
jgi:signal peptidase II